MCLLTNTKTQFSPAISTGIISTIFFKMFAFTLIMFTPKFLCFFLIAYVNHNLWVNLIIVGSGDVTYALIKFNNYVCRQSFTQKFYLWITKCHLAIRVTRTILVPVRTLKRFRLQVFEDLKK